MPLKSGFMCRLQQLRSEPEKLCLSCSCTPISPFLWTRFFVFLFLLENIWRLYFIWWSFLQEIHVLSFPEWSVCIWVGIVSENCIKQVLKYNSSESHCNPAFCGSMVSGCHVASTHCTHWFGWLAVTFIFLWFVWIIVRERKMARG